jgi:cell division protease FtsH
MQAGLLLYGPPGNGKTELAKAVAEALGLYFISVSPSDILGTLVGATEQNIAHLFREAKAHAPAMIFFDEIDAIGYQRGGANPYHDSQLNELLRAIQGFESRHNVFLLAATNRIELLDEALIRKGRFDKHLYVGNPSVKDIQKQLFVWASVLDVDKDVHWLQVAPWLEGCSGAEIRGLVDDWKRQAIDLEYRKKKPILSREYLWGTVDTLRAAKGWPPIPESERTVRWGS